MTTNYLVQEYYLSNYIRCPKNEGLLSSWESLAYPSHLFMIMLMPLYIFGGYCILYKTPNSMKPVKWPLFNWHVW
ncbi:Protein CBG27125 [Caenorhabditis briggsae]|uniref:Protein CBG27125 n=1 Tax=Caenorhabditis briggsae TaxID=6238 RepID=B6IHJ9_CAEBR|nr:Protein CBG27125 [Caenorhabditis briggsae]CAR99379.1 Protein CBG27125 [Caenorhabditis briggsae]